MWYVPCWSLGKRHVQKLRRAQGLRVPPTERKIVRRGCSTGLRVRTKEGVRPPSGELKRVAAALLKAVAFVHGQHTWPQFYRARKGFNALEEWTRAADNLPRSTYIPVPETACANGASLQDVFERLMSVLLANDKFADKFAHNLFLSREAGGDATPRSVSSLELCAVFEGMMDLLHAKFVVSHQTAEQNAFEEKKAQLAAFVAEQLKSSLMNQPKRRWNGLPG